MPDAIADNADASVDMSISGHRVAWQQDRKVEWPCIAAGKPRQSGFVLRCNGRQRDECLNQHLVSSLHHARPLIPAWRDDDNHCRPHTSLDGLTPREFFNRPTKDQNLIRTNF